MSNGYRVTIRQGWYAPEQLLNSEKSDKIRLETAQITKGINSYDSFQFTISPTHPQYSNINIFTSFVKVIDPKESKVLFEGRVITPDDAMDSGGIVQKTITCESLEGFLHDSVQPFLEFHNTTPKDFLQALINEHNKQVEDYKKILLGNVTVTNSTDNVYRFTEDDKDTYDNIQDKLVTRLGGEITLRHEFLGLYLDYMPQIGGNESSQKIELAHNLVSLERTVDPNSVFTVLKPLGATQEPTDSSSSSSTDVAYPRLTIASVNNGSPYLYADQAMIEKYGKQVKVNTWDDVTTADALLSKGKAFLDAQASFKNQIQVAYVDMAHISPDKFNSLNCGDMVTIVSSIQGINLTERITGMLIDLLNIAESTLTIGEDDMNQLSYEKMRIDELNSEKEALVGRLNAQNSQIFNLINKNKSLNTAVDNLGTNYDTLSSQVKDIINNNDVWVSGGKFIDTSSNNGTMSVSDFKTLYDSGVKGIIVKATEGTTYVNSLAASHLVNANSAGIKTVGAYHFLVGSSTGTAQGQAFLAEIQALGLPKTTIVACDIEDGSLSSDLAALNSMISDFYAVLTAAGYTNTCDYASASWFGSRFTSTAKLKWIASIGTSTKPNGADAWQYTWTYNGGSLDCSYSYNKAFV
ncbi:phage tail protein [Liquorilactobacillus satsumensis]|uniref:phage tail spike protein n=1 Tax=Liquorilactobacillus satsumensis TaxID=259059 RepID=UPI0021C3EDC7|nr:phage tail spike protein [Liquorilactobacillus satsumensis]MCP9357368.1 phage tail protein [Liquorilactobacillus satsumensis]MCP9372072.1 phage tail protein [Liquorilactobacillus satsumensis]